MNAKGLSEPNHFQRDVQDGKSRHESDKNQKVPEWFAGQAIEEAPTFGIALAKNPVNQHINKSGKGAVKKRNKHQNTQGKDPLEQGLACPAVL
jgi:hypothetical protein